MEENKRKMQFSSVPNDIKNINTQAFEECENYNGSKWVSYGKNNLYPEYLWDLYLNCSTHQAIIDGKIDYVLGEGFASANKSKKKVLKKIASDYIIYGGFAIQLIYNAIGNIEKIQPMDFSRCRVNKDLTKLYYSAKWNRSSGKNIEEFDIFDENQPVKYDEQGNIIPKYVEVYYFRGTKTRSVYPIPSYIGSTQSIETSIEIQNYHLNAIRNNFAVSAIINFVGDPSDEEKDAIDKGIRENFQGSDSASNFMITYTANKDEQTTVTRLESDKADERFEQLSKDVRENIFIGHRVVSGALFGLVSESTGFNSTEYQESFKIFNKTVIQPIQELLTDSLATIYGVEDEIVEFKIPFEQSTVMNSTPQNVLLEQINKIIDNKINKNV